MLFKRDSIDLKASRVSCALNKINSKSSESHYTYVAALLLLHDLYREVCSKINETSVSRALFGSSFSRPFLLEIVEWNGRSRKGPLEPFSAVFCQKALSRVRPSCLSYYYSSTNHSRIWFFTEPRTRYSLGESKNGTVRATNFLNTPRNQTFSHVWNSCPEWNANGKLRQTPQPNFLLTARSGSEVAFWSRVMANEDSRVELAQVASLFVES